jgi:hypothetical protein
MTTAAGQAEQTAIQVKAAAAADEAAFCDDCARRRPPTRMDWRANSPRSRKPSAPRHRMWHDRFRRCTN